MSRGADAVAGSRAARGPAAPRAPALARLALVWCAAAAVLAGASYAVLWVAEGAFPVWVDLARALVVLAAIAGALALAAAALVVAWRRRAIALAPAALAGLAAALWIAGLRLPSDASLRWRFHARRSDFDRLGAMLREDAAGQPPGRRALTLPIAAGATPPRPGSRRAAYERVLRRLGLPDGLVPATNFFRGGDPSVGDATLAWVWNAGFLGDYQQAGYAYAPGAAGPALAAAAARRACPGISVRPLGGGWYQYRYWNCPPGGPPAAGASPAGAGS